MAREDMHDVGEERENDTRRDDVLEREFNRGTDRNDQEYDLRRRMAEQSFQQSAELFNTRQVARDNQGAVSGREDQAYSGLTFRDAAIHSTSVGALEAEEAIVGDEEMENVPDEEHPDSTNMR